MESKKFSIFNFLIDCGVAFAAGVLTYLVGRDSMGLETGSMAAAAVAGGATGIGTCLGYEFGVNDWSNRTGNVVSGIAGALVGAGLAACIGIG